MSFDTLGLSNEVVHGVQSMGFVDPTPIQAQAIPVILSGRDLIASAQTGTGKTAAFAMPILTLLKKRGPFRCLVLEPTRELAIQVDEAFRNYGRFTDLESALMYGGVGYGTQRDQLKRGADVGIATPGRLLDFLEQGDLKLDALQYLVLDEVDRMLDMGFLPQVRKIVEQCPKTRQTMVFSATIPPVIERFATWVLSDPATVDVGERRSPAETVAHALFPVARDQKLQLLLALLEATHYDSVIVFCRTKDGADNIAAHLTQAKHSVAALHSNRSQRERTEALDGFRSGKFEVLVATDIAARGLDIRSVTHVVNYDVPQNPEDYVHRIGRTGRAQAEGDAFTIMTGEDVDEVRKIEDFIGQKIEKKRLPDFPYLYTALFGDPPAKKKRRR